MSQSYFLLISMVNEDKDVVICEYFLLLTQSAMYWYKFPVLMKVMVIV